MIQGLTGQLDMWRNREPFRPNYPEMVDELFAGGEAPPTLVAFVDCWTSLGGSQFLNSPGTGRYQDFLCDEAVAFVDERYRTIPRSRSPRDPGQVERRLRRARDPDAAAGRVLGARVARR